MNNSESKALEQKPDFKKIAEDHYDRVGRNPSKKLDYHEVASYAKGYKDCWLSLQSENQRLTEENKELKRRIDLLHGEFTTKGL